MQDMRSINSRWVVRYEPPSSNLSRDVWHQIVPCRHGHFYQHGPGMLGFASKLRGHKAKAVAALDGVEVWQDGSDGLNLVFPVSIVEQVSAIVVPRCKRRLSEEQKEMLAARMRKLNERRQQGATNSAPERTRSHFDDKSVA